jgi:3-oxoadipate enol-lactonase
MPVIDVGGTPIHVEVEGAAKAPVLMFSNSLGTNLHMWDEQAEVFAKHFRVVRYDQRGHGKSGAPAGPYSMDLLGQDALAIMNHLGLTKVNWCGLSMGGMTGMWLGRHAPERIDRLVLSNCAAKSMTPTAWNTRISTVNAKGVDAVADTVLTFWFTQEFRERCPQVVARMREMMVSIDKQGYVGCCAAVRDMDQRWDIRDIKLPTLVIAGRHDAATTLKDGEYIAGAIAGAKLVVLDAAHISNIAVPAPFTDAVENFLKKG